MNLKTRLSEDMKAAMRAKNQVTLSTIRLINAAVKQFEVDERIEANDEKIMAIISKMIKQRKDSANIYMQAQRQDLADKELNEIEILTQYLPAMLSHNEIQQIVQEVLKEMNANSMADMGKVMGILKNRLNGQADMGEVNQIVKTILTA